MEIPQRVQEKLKCSDCDELLSCGPVYLLHETGGTICGRCSQHSEDPTEYKDRTRNEPYEATASLLAFPCTFATRGCLENVSFTLGRPLHELNCKFRPFFCPIAPQGSCDWVGSWSSLKEHCDEKHAANVLENECSLPRPDLSASNLQTYLIFAFNYLFLLHVKVCVGSRKLFHSIRMFTDLNLIEKFSYFFAIEGNGFTIKKEGNVLSTELMILQESTANCISIKSLLEMLDCKYNELKFIITIKTSINFNCLNCSKNIVHVSESKICKECLKKLVKCKFSEKNCPFADVNKRKCGKHERYFCEYQTKCFIHNCEVNFVGVSFIEYLESSNSCHKTIKANINSVVRVTDTNSKWHFILFSSNNIGTIICTYKLFNSNLDLNLYTSLLSFELKSFKCSIELTDPHTKLSKIFTQPVDYNYWWDWSINEKMDKFTSCKNNGINMKINIDKV